ncbi:MAG: outer membrane beta-barrel protein [Bacteroidota bacterium]
MKNFIIHTIISLSMISLVHAQDIEISSKSAKARIGDIDISVKKGPFMQGDWELTMSGALGQYTTKTTTSMNSWNYGNESKENFATISLTAGYYFIDWLSLEPEVNLFAYEGGQPGESVLLNLSFTYPLEHSIVAPFIRGGFGLGNAGFITGNLPFSSFVSDKFDVKTFNAGAGVKLLIAQSVALKIELNYRYQTYTENYTGCILYSVNNKNSMIRLFVGFSVLL